MRLWTIQTQAAWEHLLTRNVLYGKRRFIWDGDPGEEIMLAYEWMREQMERRVGPRPFPEAYPVWAWAQWNDVRHAKPDLRVGGHLPAGTEGVRLELEMPEERVLLSDFSLWTWYGLNYWYLPVSSDDEQQFAGDCDHLGLDFYQMKPLPDAGLHKRLLASWERIFDLEWVDEYVTSQRRENKHIQATLWGVSLDDVRAAHLFRAR